MAAMERNIAPTPDLAATQKEESRIRTVIIRAAAIRAVNIKATAAKKEIVARRIVITKKESIIRKALVTMKVKKKVPVKAFESTKKPNQSTIKYFKTVSSLFQI